MSLDQVGDGFFSWLPPLFKYKEADLLPIIGLDAVTFLRFLRLLRWLITVLAVLFSVVLMPVDIAYNLKNVDTEDRKGLNIITLVNVHGGSIWAHVAMSYIGTFIALGFSKYMRTGLETESLRVSRIPGLHRVPFSTISSLVPLQGNGSPSLGLVPV